MSEKKNGKLTTETDADFFGADGASPASMSPESTVKTPVAAVVQQPLEVIEEKKTYRYHSRRAEFGACVIPRQILRDGQGRVVREVPAKYVQFKDNKLETSDPQIIGWMEGYINNRNHSLDEVFRVPELDPMMDGDFVSRLDSMQMTELRAACRQRGLDFATNDDEPALRYKLLKLLSGFGAKKTT